MQNYKIQYTNRQSADTGGYSEMRSHFPQAKGIDRIFLPQISCSNSALSIVIARINIAMPNLSPSLIPEFDSANVNYETVHDSSAFQCVICNVNPIEYSHNYDGIITR